MKKIILIKENLISDEVAKEIVAWLEKNTKDEYFCEFARIEENIDVIEI